MEENVIVCPKCGHRFEEGEAISESLRHRQQELLLQKERELEEKSARRLAETQRQLAEVQKQNEMVMKDKIAFLERQNKINEDKIKTDADLKYQEALNKAVVAETEARLKAQKELAEAKATKDQLAQEYKRSVESELKKMQEKHQKELEEIESRHAVEKERAVKSLKPSLSQELQGEEAEYSVLNYLKSTFPSDTVEEVPKGYTGADIVHTVKDTNTGIVRGVVLYEVKNTKEFASDWTEKLRKDMKDKNAALGILLTRALPAKMSNAGQKISFAKDTLITAEMDSLPVVAPLARELLVRSYHAEDMKKSAEERRDVLWNRVNSPAFKETVKNLDETFKKMKEQVEKQHKSNIKYYEKQVLALDTIMTGIVKVSANLEFGDAGQPLLEDGEDDPTEAD